MKDSELNDRAGVLLIMFSIVLLKKTQLPSEARGVRIRIRNT